MHRPFDAQRPARVVNTGPCLNPRTGLGVPAVVADTDLERGRERRLAGLEGARALERKAQSRARRTDTIVRLRTGEDRDCVSDANWTAKSYLDAARAPPVGSTSIARECVRFSRARRRVAHPACQIGRNANGWCGRDANRSFWGGAKLPVGTKDHRQSRDQDKRVVHGHPTDDCGSRGSQVWPEATSHIRKRPWGRELPPSTSFAEAAV